jgi:hypothetical protein
MVQMVTERYRNSQLAKTSVPDILKKWEDPHVKVLQAEAAPLTLRLTLVVTELPAEAAQH